MGEEPAYQPDKAKKAIAQDKRRNEVDERIKKMIAQKVRKDSDTFSKKSFIGLILHDSERSQGNIIELSNINSLCQPATDLKIYEVKSNLAEMAKDDRYKDIKSVVTAKGATYLYSEVYLDNGRVKTLVRAEDIQTRIAEKVREDSRNLAELTNVDSLPAMMPDLAPEPGETEANLAMMAKDDRCKDIKSVVTAKGTTYLYSEVYLDNERSKTLVRAEDIQTTIAEKVRKDSKNLAKLTDADSLPAMMPDLAPKPGEVGANLAMMAKDDRYKDIKSVVTAKGTTCLYSEKHIAGSYANILVRVEVNDPCFIIAETVREESRVYPRPTDIELFKDSLFNINPDKLDAHVAHTLENYKDIKLIQTSTGVVYLHSNLYLDEVQAESLAEQYEEQRRAKD